MDIPALLDPWSALLVFGGTLGAVVLRSGWRDSRHAAATLARLAQPAFDAVQAKAQLATYVQSVDVDGLMRAQPVATGDGEIDSAIDTLAHSRSLSALTQDYEAHRHDRLAASDRAAAVLGTAVELAPVMGLAGTLLALGQLSGLAAAGGDYPTAIARAVTTTLYGLVFANFVFAPLEGAIARKAAAEDGARRQLVDWLASHAQAARSRATDRPARHGHPA